MDRAKLAGKQFKNILVIRLRAFGDSLLTTPTLRGLKAAYPQAKLSVLLEPAMMVTVQGLPYVDTIVPFDRLALKKQGFFGELLGTLRFYAWLRRQRYDLVIDVLGTPRTAMMCLASGAKTRVGFAFRFRKYAYNVVHTPSPQRRYIADYTADTLRALGHEPDSLNLDFAVSPQALEYSESFFKRIGLAPEQKLIMVAPAGGWELKRYPPRLFREVLSVVQKKSDLPVVVLWGPGEEELARETSQGFDGQVFLAPPSSFEQMGALLKRACLLISNDGATKHLAVAVGTPTLTIFGPTSDIAWHPPAQARHRSVKLSLECMPCEALHCRLGTHECLQALEPKLVAQAALEMLAQLQPALL